MNNKVNGLTRKSFIHRLAESMGDQKECWNWSGHIGKNGYAYATWNGIPTTAYRASWMHFRGEIPEGYEIDHLCKNPRCINPFHLEPVTPRENNMRSNSPAAIASRKTHCSNGHAFSLENTATINRANGKKDRRCKLCHASRARSFNQRKSNNRPVNK